ncbi:outer envelope protein 80 [Hibiscus syriacus]|uniref:Outer envelope protein 80 n=1 Tax=Hibiscus syriacus TaxID=106335 RepID=A0A6A2ZJ95_HIBSY|nr:outer envelope protein 80 [Hibiscus syriacus]
MFPGNSSFGLWNLTLLRGTYFTEIVFPYLVYGILHYSLTLISATRRLLATAILDDPSNEYFAVVSQYCIPHHSFNYIYRSHFTSKNFDRTSKYDNDSSGFTQYGVLKHKSYIEILSEEPRLWKRYAARGRFVMMPEVPFEEFRAGSQFFVLTRKDSLLVLKDRTLWSKFKLPCFRADERYPEEHYFPTLLSMQDPNGVTGYTLARVNWNGTVEGHPHMYKPKEVTPELIHELRKSNYSGSYLFARKFSADCLRPLMRIADSLIFRD